MPRGNPGKPRSWPRLQPLADRFWAKVIRADGCWDWIGYRDKAGYGRLGLGGRRRGIGKAHRVSWELHFGPIPEGLMICHKCDNPPCTNPEHLFLGTMGDNMRDMSRKGRAGRVFGPDNRRSRLTANAAMEIYRRAASGEQMKKLSAEFGVTPPAVRDIVRGITWAWATGAERRA